MTGVIAVTVFYLMIGFGMVLIVEAFWEQDDGYVEIGMMILWPLFIIKYVVLSVFLVFKFIGKNIPRWTIVPMATVTMFKRTGRVLLGMKD